MNFIFIYLSHLLFPLFYYIGWFESSLSFIMPILYIIIFILFIILSSLLFIIYFEFSITILLFLLLIKSYSNYRIRSSFIYFIYSSFSSLLFGFISILYIGFILFSSILYIGLLFIISIGIKIPIFPFHYWLTIVHSEASTSVSLLLASLILKIAIFALIRYYIFYFFITIYYYISILFIFTFLGVIIPIIESFIRMNYKILIALSSISHMNLTAASIFILNYSGFSTGIIISISHALTSTALFLLCGLIINKTLCHYIDSIWFISISYRFILFTILLANLSLPLTLTFIGEILAIYTLINYSFIISIILFILSSILSSIIAFLFYNRVIIYIYFIYSISITELLLLLFYAIHNYSIGSLFFIFIVEYFILLLNYLFRNYISLRSIYY